ncbi:MAG TPA: DJ-1/PfpI family protein [Allosphingosinicella sp.]
MLRFARNDEGKTMLILIYLYDGVTALDAVGPYESLSRLPGVEIRFVGRRAGPVRTGDGALALNADTGINDEIAADMLIVPGGRRAGVQREMGEERVLGWMAVLDTVTTRTCSVCTGSILLGAAGLLEGRRASTHWGARDYLGHFGATYSAERVTEDGKYLTSAGVSAGIDLGLTLCAEIAGREMAEAVQLSMEYDPKPPFDAGNFRDATPERLAMVAKLDI